MADVIGRALVFRARVAVITIGDDKAAILFRRIFAVACVEVAHLESARIAIVGAVCVLLAAARKNGVETLLSTDVACVRCTHVAVIAWCGSVRTVIRIHREDARVGRGFANVECGRIRVVALRVRITTCTNARRTQYRYSRVAGFAVRIACVDGANVEVIAI